MRGEKMRLILASNSPRRRELLQQAGLDFQVMPSDCEEICTMDVPEALVEDLARQKAENVAEKVRERQMEKDSSESGDADLPEKGKGNEIDSNAGKLAEDAIILGADTVVAMDGKILGKPRDEEEAFRMIQGLQGKVHQVYSGVALLLLSPEGRKIARTKTFHVRTQVEVYPMEEEEILAYIATGEPMDKAGAYGIQGRFAAYIKGIVGDYYNVVGLPVSRLVRELKEMREG